MSSLQLYSIFYEYVPGLLSTEGQPCTILGNWDSEPWRLGLSISSRAKCQDRSFFGWRVEPCWPDSICKRCGQDLGNFAPSNISSHFFPQAFNMTILQPQSITRLGRAWCGCRRRSFSRGTFTKMEVLEQIHMYIYIIYIYTSIVPLSTAIDGTSSLACEGGWCRSSEALCSDNFQIWTVHDWSLCWQDFVVLLWALKQLTPVGYESQNWMRVNYNCNKADNKSFHWGVVQANQPSLDELECHLNDLFQPGGVSVCRSILFTPYALPAILTARIWRSLQPKAVQISQAPDWEALGMTWPLIIWLWFERDEWHKLDTKFCWLQCVSRLG